jgi:hypothetical protein
LRWYVTYLSLGWAANKRFRRRIEGAMKIVMYRHPTAEVLNLAELQTKPLILVISPRLSTHSGLQLRVAVLLDEFRHPER